MAFYRKLAGRGMFSLMELALIVSVLGVVATIVGPRMSRGEVSSKSGEQLLIGQLRQLRSAIAAYTMDHDGIYPQGDVSRIVRQLTQYSDEAGEVSPTATARHHFGPYIREFPRLAVGEKKGSATVGLWPDDGYAAWVYNPATAQIWANTWPGERDETGRKYSAY